MYDSDAIPADWNLAQNHAKARQTAPAQKRDIEYQDDIPFEKCRCCAQQIERVPLDYFCSLNELSFLGPGYVLYFAFARQCIILLCLQSILGIIELGLNYTGAQYTDFLIRISLINGLSSDEVQNQLQKLRMLMMLLSACLLIAFRRQDMRLESELTEGQDFAENYSILVTNIPSTLNVNYLWEITNMFQNYAILDSEFPIRVTKVTLIYNIAEINALRSKISGHIDNLRLLLVRHKFLLDHQEIIDERNLIKTIKSQILDIQEEYLHISKQFSGKAIVSFKSETMKNTILEHNKASAYSHFNSLLHDGKSPKLDESILQWHKHQIFLEQAPAPYDIDWLFISNSYSQEIILKFKGQAIQFLFQIILFISMYICLNINITKDNTSLQASFKSNTIFHLTLIIFVIMNQYIVRMITHKILKSEQYPTKSSYQLGYISRFAIHYLLNSSLSFYIINLVYPDYTDIQMFIMNITYFFLYNQTLPHIYYLIDPFSLIKRIQRVNEINKGIENTFTQKEANTLCEEESFIPEDRYGYLMATVWLSYCIGQIAPIGIIISLCGLILFYHIDKYNTLRRRTVNQVLTMNLTRQASRKLGFVLFLQPIGAFLISYALGEALRITDIVMLIVGCGYQLLPIDDIFELFFAVKSLFDPHDYDQVENIFQYDYDTLNPITKIGKTKQIP